MRPTKIIRGREVRLSRDGTHMCDLTWQQVLYELNRENLQRIRAQNTPRRMRSAA